MENGKWKIKAPFPVFLFSRLPPPDHNSGLTAKNEVCLRQIPNGRGCKPQTSGVKKYSHPFFGRI